MTTLAIIPARSGSKGVLDKNIRLVGGKSLLERAIDSGLVDGIDFVYVSTDDERYRNIAIKRGAKCYDLRPKSISGDLAKTADVVKYAVEEFEAEENEKVSTIVLLEPTSPFRNKNHVEEALKIFRSNGYSSLVSVCSLEKKPQNIYIKNKILERYIRDPCENFNRRQDMTHLCRINSAIYIIKKQNFMNTCSFMKTDMGWYQMDDISSINIDVEIDLEIADLLSQKYNL